MKESKKMVMNIMKTKGSEENKTKGGKRILFILFLILLGIIVISINNISAAYTDNGSLAQNVDDCGTLNTTNAVYNLTTNVTSNSTCFNIIANNITLDGVGYTINYSANGTVG